MARRDPQRRTPLGKKERQPNFPDRSGVPFGRTTGFATPNNQLDPVARGKRTPPKRPTNPHDPTSKDPFMRAGMGLGKNDTDIFSRAGISMNRKKMRM